MSGYAPVIGAAGGEFAKVDGGTVGAEPGFFNHHMIKIGIRRYLKVIGGIGGGSPRVGLIPLCRCAVNGRQEGHLVGFFGGKSVDGRLEFVVPSIHHTHSIPVARA